jgi:hypothetical protein
MNGLASGSLDRPKGAALRSADSRVPRRTPLRVTRTTASNPSAFPGRASYSTIRPVFRNGFSWELDSLLWVSDLSFDHGDAVDFDVEVAGPCGNVHEDPRRRILGEEALVDLVDGIELLD